MTWMGQCLDGSKSVFSAHVVFVFLFVSGNYLLFLLEFAFVLYELNPYILIQ